MNANLPTTGLLVLGFKRPALLQKTIRQIETNLPLSEFDIFLSLDGPKDNHQKRDVEKCRKVFELFSEGFDRASKLYSDKNQGLRTKVIDSVTEAFKTVDNLIVLEDDCLIGESTIDFFNWGFEQIDSRDDIAVISGTYLGRSKSNKAFLARRFSSWGWATNKRTWQRFLESCYLQVQLVELHSEIARLTAKDPFPYRYEYLKISRNLSNLDSWAVPFDLFLRSENLFAIKPIVNQIQNIGFGDNSSHTGRGSSLSIKAGHLDFSKLQLTSPDESAKIERAEAWSKFAKLAKELLVRGD